MENLIWNRLDPVQFCENHLKNKLGGGRLLMCKIWGSHSHNTELPTSDVDYVGVYVAGNRELLGCLTKPQETLTGDKPDYQIHEVGKFCDLLMKGNPGIIEMLFTERMTWADQKWDGLLKHKKDFLTQRAVKQYLGYAQAQIKRLECGQSVHSKGGKVGEKWAYHMYRLVQDAKRIAEGGEPKVWKEGPEREVLMQIRTGEIQPLDVVKMTREEIARIDANPVWKTNLPEEGNEVVLDDWILWVRGLNHYAP